MLSYCFCEQIETYDYFELIATNSYIFNLWWFHFGLINWFFIIFWQRNIGMNSAIMFVEINEKVRRNRLVTFRTEYVIHRMSFLVVIDCIGTNTEMFETTFNWAICRFFRELPMCNLTTSGQCNPIIPFITVILWME